MRTIDADALVKKISDASDCLNAYVESGIVDEKQISITKEIYAKVISVINQEPTLDLVEGTLQKNAELAEVIKIKENSISDYRAEVGRLTKEITYLGKTIVWLTNQLREMCERETD